MFPKRMPAILLATNAIVLVVSMIAHLLAESQACALSWMLPHVKAVGLLLFLFTWPFALGVSLGAQPESRPGRISMWLYVSVTGAVFLWIVVSLIANVFGSR